MDGEAALFALNARGIKAYEESDYAEANRLFEQGLGLSMTRDERATTHINLAHSFREMGNAQKSIEHFKQALIYLHSQSADAAAVRGHLAWIADDLEEAVLQFESALVQEPQNQIANNALGTLYLGDDMHNVWDFERAKIFNELVSDSPIARKNLAKTHFELGEFAVAHELYHDISHNDPYDAEAAFMLGMIDILQFKDVEAAITQLEKAAALDAEYRSALEQVVIYSRTSENLALSR